MPDRTLSYFVSDVHLGLDVNDPAVSILGMVKPIGGVRAKISAAVKGGAQKVIIPKDNYVSIT